MIHAIGFCYQTADQHHLVPMLERIAANIGQRPEKLIADAGYCSIKYIEASEALIHDIIMPAGGRCHSQRGRRY
jgi:hypothetical protein